MGNSYVGALSYADDITLLCPSIRGLNKMLDICNSFADMYDIKFNAKKSLGIKFGGQQVMSEVLYLGNSRIEWVSSVKHLGNYVNSDMTDKTDCDMKCSSFIGYVNKLKANFGYLQPFVLGNLFKTFCCSFYGSHCGDLTHYLSRKFARLGILVCDLYLTYHTEHILIFLALYCNNRISVSNCILKAPNFFIICIILTIVLCRHVL